MLARIPTHACFGLNNALTRPDPEIAWKWPGKAFQASGAFRAQPPQSWDNMSMRKLSTILQYVLLINPLTFALVHARIVLYRITVKTAMPRVHTLLRCRAVPSVMVALGAIISTFFSCNCALVDGSGVS